MNTTQTTLLAANARVHEADAMRVLSADEIALIGAAGVSVDEFPVIPR